jgi:hypothetical protein
MPNNKPPPLEPIAVSPQQATQLVPIGLTKLYEAINTGALESRVVNGRRWIDFQSLKRFAGVGAYAVARKNPANQIQAKSISEPAT